MKPAVIVQAQATTNSADDQYGRVKIKANGIWEETEEVLQVGGLSIVKDDWLLVDVSNGFELPLIVGKLKNSTEYDVLLYHGKDKNSKESTLCMSPNELHYKNSDGAKIDVVGGTVTINDNLEISL